MQRHVIRSIRSYRPYCTQILPQYRSSRKQFRVLGLGFRAWVYRFGFNPKPLTLLPLTLNPNTVSQLFHACVAPGVASLVAMPWHTPTSNYCQNAAYPCCAHGRGLRAMLRTTLRLRAPRLSFLLLHTSHTSTTALSCARV